MDTKFLNRISAYFLMVVMLLSLATGFVVSLERVMLNNGYIKDNATIQADTLRLAKNLQRYYIYYGSFDEDAAQQCLDEIYRFKLAKNTAYTAAETPVVDVYGRSIPGDDKYIDRGEKDTNVSGEEAERKFSTDIPYPEQLYSTDFTTLSDEMLDEREQQLSEALENYKNIENYLSSMRDFHFYVFDKSRNICIATNTEDIFNEKYYDYIEISDSLFDENFNGEAINLSFSKQNYIGLITIPVTGLSVQMQNAINYTYNLYSINKVVSSIYLPAIFFALGLGLFLYLIFCRRDEMVTFKEKLFKYYMILPFILKVIIFMIVCIELSVLYMSDKYTISYMLANMSFHSATLFVLMVAFMFLVLIMGFEHFYKFCKRQVRLRDEAEAKMIASCVRDIKIAIKANEQIVVCVSVLLIIMAFVPIPFLILNALMRNPLSAVFWLCLYCIYCFVLWLFYKYINNNSKLRYYIREMAKGNINTIPEEKGVFSKPINNLNNINAGLKANLEEMIKSERLKTELITNVSHDLKTPLTSIINYLSLLKTLNLDNEQAKEYIDIANDKAKRLNVLILDLFEASKLNSGQMTLEKMPSDIVALLNQTLGELDYKISQSGIDFKVNLPNNPIIIEMDGQRMWRVFDNLLSNILKYSPKNSRGYVNMEEYEDRVEIIFKNMSSYPLDFDGAELFERFKRGDVSRSTDGSGLGLSIAKSIVELHGGTLDIVIDGDLFKTIVTLYK